MKKLLLVRHGQTDWNVQGRYQGQSGAGLNATGIAQAHRAAEVLTTMRGAAIYSSDQQRALQTAQVISDHCGFPLVVEPCFREICLGDWEGLLGVDIERSHPDLIEQRRREPRTFRAPGKGESLEDIARRVQPALRMLSELQGGDVIIVSHHVCLGVVRAILEGREFDDVYGSPLGNGVIYECAPLK